MMRTLLLVGVLGAVPGVQSDSANQPNQTIASLEQAVAEKPADIERRRRLAEAYAASGRRLDAVATLQKVTELAPTLPSAWYALGQGYNAIKQEALQSFDDRADLWWQQLLSADALLERGQLVDAFGLYRDTLERLPTMVSIHDSVARVYERSGHAAWALRERHAGALAPAECASRKPLCEFRAGRYGPALSAALDGTDSESRYWRARAAAELALAAFKHLDQLPDSTERRAVRATQARLEERYTDAARELQAALTLAPGNPALQFDLASSYYEARDYELALSTLEPLLGKYPDDRRLLRLRGYSLLQLRRIDEAIPVLRGLADGDPSDPTLRLALGRAYLQNGNFAEAIPLIEPELDRDRDGSLHIQLARAYTGLGQTDKAATLLARAQDLQRADEERNAAAARRTITPPKS